MRFRVLGSLGCFALVLQGQAPLGADVSLASASVDYPWLADLPLPWPPMASIEEHFSAPAGFQRVSVPEDSYAGWLRGLPVRTDRTHVLAYNGEILRRPSAAVLLLDVGERDLMQCADSIIRLRAEYLWSRGRADEAAFRFTSGDLSRWRDWQQGERFVIRGNTVERLRGAPRSEDHPSYRKWMDLVFTYAGTSSVARDAWTPPRSQAIGGGDFFVDPGFPGHAVIILDVVEDPSGARLALMGQGFMPAEEVHVLRSPKAVMGHWFPLPEHEAEVLDTPSWRPFPMSARRRFR